MPRLIGQSLLTFTNTSSSFVYTKHIFFSAKGLKPRNERLFYVFTSKTTSTAITNTYCYVSTNTALTTICGRRKRRATIDDFSSDSINPKFLEGKTR